MFNVTPTLIINEHIKNIYSDAELNEVATLRKFGNSGFSTKPTNFYNLDGVLKAYGELRFIGYAPIERQVFCVVYTDRGDVRRIISLHKGRGKNISSSLAGFFARTLRCRKGLHTISMRPFIR